MTNPLDTWRNAITRDVCALLAADPLLDGVARAKALDADCRACDAVVAQTDAPGLVERAREIVKELTRRAEQNDKQSQAAADSRDSYDDIKYHSAAEAYRDAADLVREIASGGAS